MVFRAWRRSNDLHSFKKLIIFNLSDRSSPITALWNFVNIRRFTFQAFLVWATLGIPGNIVTLYLFNDTSPNPTQPELPIVENNTEFTCHEVKAEWQEYVALSKLYIQGIYNVWRSPKKSHLNFPILAFSTNFCPITIDLQVFKNSPKWTIFWHF